MSRNMAWTGFLATVLILVTLVLAVIREPAIQARAAETQLIASVTEGMDIYLENCVVCHGAAGEGLGSYPSLALVSDMDAETLYKTIERGRFNTQMAAYGVNEGGILGDAQIDSLVSLIQNVNWRTVYTRAEALDVLPPQLVAAPVSEETLVQVSALADGTALADGLELYAANCVSCHGPNLEGSSIAPTLNTDVIRQTDGFELARIIEQGVPGTLMAGWSNALTSEEISALVQLLQRWDEVQNMGVAVPVVEVPPIDMSPEIIASGARLFNITCTSCHGTGGYGTVMAPALNNSLFLTTTSDTQIHQIIAMGVPGTIMPAWSSRLSDTEINALIAYMRSWEADAPIITQAR
ncbi:MAG: c-type cytochrome [Anaerolineaceae bacterium]|nr:c-type cytochrome [Anaerolineaceae bacterium]MCB9457907.1 c-type cytochrome [Anaerolineaceae bacterium]